MKVFGEIGEAGIAKIEVKATLCNILPQKRDTVLPPGPQQSVNSP